MSNLSEEEILDKLRKMLFHTIEANKCGLSNNDFKEDIDALSGILGIYQDIKEQNKLMENKIRELNETKNEINNKLNENEKILIEDLQKYILFAKKEQNFNSKEEYDWHIELSDRVSYLLNLYKKEKEKNKLLIEGKFREVADKNSYIKDNYISKDKIKEKIEEIDNTGLNICNEQLNYQMKLQDEAKISVLQELLEERN